MNIDDTNGPKMPKVDVDWCAGGWQPIETAPKDGSYILAYWPGDVDEDTPAKTWWGAKNTGSNKYGWHSPFEFASEGQDYAPTHWMPLPNPPRPPT